LFLLGKRRKQYEHRQCRHSHHVNPFDRLVWFSAVSAIHYTIRSAAAAGWPTQRLPAGRREDESFLMRLIF